MIHKDEEEEDSWGFLNILETNSNVNKDLYEFNPFYDPKSPFILTIEVTEKGMFILLRNGLIIKLTSDSKKIDSVYSNSKLNNTISIGTKIIDISCGKEHILARGRDCRVYSWGINSYGQLGIEKKIEKLGPNAEINKPTEIEELSNRKINQIFTFDYTSFCIDPINDVYGFGKNEQGLINFNIPDIKIPIPIKADFTLDKGKNFTFTLFKGDNCKYINEMYLPEKTLEHSINSNTNEINEDNKLRYNIIQLKKKLDGLKKVRTTIDDYQDLIKNIRELIKKFGGNSKKKEKIKYYPKTTRNNISIQNFDKGIEYVQDKKNNMSSNDYLDNYLNELDGRIYINKTKQEENNYKLNNVQLYSKNIPQIGTLFERVSSELQIRKNKYFEAIRKGDEEIKEFERIDSKNYEYVHVFEEVINDINNKISHLVDKDTLEEAENIRDKCFSEFQNFNQNILNEITISNLDIQKAVNISLDEFIQISSSNLLKLTEKIKNLKIHSLKNSIGRNVLDMFDKDIILAHQNNYLLSFILDKLANPVYFKTLEKGISNVNFKDFNKQQHKIYEYKNQNSN